MEGFGGFAFGLVFLKSIILPVFISVEIQTSLFHRTQSSSTQNPTALKKWPGPNTILKISFTCILAWNPEFVITTEQQKLHSGWSSYHTFTTWMKYFSMFPQQLKSPLLTWHHFLMWHDVLLVNCGQPPNAQQWHLPTIPSIQKTPIKQLQRIRQFS